MEIIRTYAKGTDGYERLSKAAEILTLISPKGWKYHVGDCYFDLGQDWMHTTILCNNGETEWQAVCPRDYEKILTYDNLLTALDEIVRDEWWNDKE